MYYCYVPSPIGDLLVAGNADGLEFIGFPSGKMRRDPEPQWIFKEAPFVEAPGQPLSLGEAIISHPRATAQAVEAGHSVEAELALLAVHGTLHLLGYDHATPEEKAVMWAAQEAILAGLDLKLSMGFLDA